MPLIILMLLPEPFLIPQSHPATRMIYRCGRLDYDDVYYRINPRDAGDVISNVSVDPTPGNELVIQNSPNPFGGTTTISFSLPHNVVGEINIYNIHGQLVKTLIPEDQSATWNGMDAGGKVVANGIYFYTLDTGKEIVTKKMILMK